MNNAEGRSVRFLGVPTEVFVRTQHHVDELLHELELVHAGSNAGVASPPDGLRELMEEILGDYTDARQTAWDQAKVAGSQGRDRFDLELALPPEAPAATTRLLSLLEQADEYCRSRRLLTLEAPPDVVSLRRWMTAEIVAQIEEGADPTPCPV